MRQCSFPSSPLRVPAPRSTRSTLEFVLTFALLFLVTNAALRYFFPRQFGGQEQPKVVTLSMEDASVRLGNDPVVIIRNDTDAPLALPGRCPLPPVDIARIRIAADGTEEAQDIIPNDSVLPCSDVAEIPAGGSARVNLAGWKYALFLEPGMYQAVLPIDGVEPARFTLSEPGIFTQLFRTLVTRPLFNALVAIAVWTPGHSLGLAIILLTIVVKLLLLLPNQHALVGQRKLQELQPRMEELKRKYKGDPTKLQEETMKLWKEMKINPLQSCLPTLLQLPILIGLFFVIRDGASLATARHLAYPAFQDLPAQFFGTSFLGLDLLQPERWIFPATLVLLQFLQMKMMMGRTKKSGEIVVKPVGRRFSWKMPELNQQTVMLYILPFMIGYFALQFPAAVSLYWGVSTLFAILQQWYVVRHAPRT